MLQVKSQLELRQLKRQIESAKDVPTLAKFASELVDQIEVLVEENLKLKRESDASKKELSQVDKLRREMDTFKRDLSKVDILVHQVERKTWSLDKAR